DDSPRRGEVEARGECDRFQSRERVDCSVIDLGVFWMALEVLEESRPMMQLECRVPVADRVRQARPRVPGERRARERSELAEYSTSEWGAERRHREDAGCIRLQESFGLQNAQESGQHSGVAPKRDG